jgi:diacylglycerol kinase (ATP)
MPVTVTRFLFVVNPISGGHSKSDIEQQARDFFKDRDCEIEFYELKGDDAVSVRHWIDKWQPHTVVVVGGDGTLKAVAQLLLNSKYNIGILPAGSSNGMSRELGLPQDMNECLEVLVTGKVKKIDAIRINDDISLHLSDIGFNAQLVKYFEETGTRGKWGYIRELGKVFLYKEQFKVQIKIDGKDIIRRAFMVVLANASRYGTGALINPDGKLDDGVFEIVIIRKISFWAIIKMFFNARRHNPNKTEILRAKTATMKIRGNAYFQVDGEYRGKVRNVEAEILPGALNVIVPEGNKEHL